MASSRQNTNRTHKSVHASSSGLRNDTTSLDSASYYTNEGEGEDIPVEKKYNRTMMLIMDYKKFKAARKIQTMVRGWLARRRYRRQKCAAIIIQREWRRYQAQRNFYRILEQRVQDAIDEYHRKAAVRIQSYWRGFLVREHVHDQYRMKRSQRMAAEDLMSCIAYKLHYLLRTYQIPGIYSLRNSHVLSKVEKILVSISFKQDNRRAFMSRINREADFKESRKNFTESEFGTRIPYSGPNFSGICDPKCVKIYKEPNIDARMHQILRKYEVEEKKQQNKQKTCPSRKKSIAITYKKPKEPGDFCTDIINSMRRWNISGPKKLEVRRDVFKNPENVEKFLNEIASIYDFMNDKGSCFCKKTNAEIIRCNDQSG